MQTVRTNGQNFEQKLLSISENVTKLIIETQHEADKCFENGGDFLSLNLSSLFRFVRVEELWRDKGARRTFSRVGQK